MTGPAGGYEGGPLRPGQLPPRIREWITSSPEGREDAEAHAEALSLIVAVHRGERPGSATPMVIQALCEIAFGEMAERNRVEGGMDYTAAIWQTVVDCESWALAFRMPDLASAPEDGMEGVAGGCG